MFKEFKEFIMRGNVLDLAVGIVIGAAFGKIVTSLVSDVVMPPIGVMLGKVDFSNLFIDLSGARLSNARGSESGWRGHHQLWAVPEYGGGFSDCGVCDLFGG